MPGYKRRFVADLNEVDRSILRNAVWDGSSWVVDTRDWNALRRLAAEQLIEERRERWVLTIGGHRHRRLIERSW